MMQVRVQFYSYFKELAGGAEARLALPEGSTVADLLTAVHERFPALAGTAKATLVAVGVDYQPRSYVLREGDEISLFPPVQGG